jgi:hypothetical protein
MTGLVCLLSLPLYGTFACGLKRTSAASRAIVPLPRGARRPMPPSARPHGVGGRAEPRSSVAWARGAAGYRASTRGCAGRQAGVRAGGRVGADDRGPAAATNVSQCWAGRAGAGRGGAPQATGMVWAGSGKYDCVTITLQSSLWLKAQRRPAGPPARRPVQVPPARRPAGWPACPAASPPQ